jgi:hypothetical protein
MPLRLTLPVLALATAATAQDMPPTPAPEILAALETVLVTFQHHCMSGLPVACTGLPQAQILGIQMVDAVWYCSTTGEPGACQFTEVAAATFTDAATALAPVAPPLPDDIPATLGFDPANPMGQSPDMRMTPADQFGPALVDFNLARLPQVTESTAALLAALAP